MPQPPTSDPVGQADDGADVPHLAFVADPPALEYLLAKEQLEAVPANLRHAGRLMTDAGRHLVTARRTAEDVETGDHAGAFVLAYDAARNDTEYPA